MIPKEIQQLKQWTISFSLKERKRPLDSLYRPNGAMDYVSAKRAAGKHKLVGFYVTPEDPYILGDIDHIDEPDNKEYLATELPIGYCDLLFNQSIYSEISPSGKGIRFIAKFKDVKTKQLFEGNYRKNRDKLGFDKDGIKREAQVNLGRPWQSITGNETSYSSGRINIIDPEVITSLFNYKMKTQDSVVGTDYRPPSDFSDHQLPFINDAVKVLKSLPWDGNPRILRAFERTFNEEYTAYEYWLKVIMAMSDYASRLSNPNDANVCLEEIVEWSKQDEDGFESEEDVIKKWESLFRTEQKVTYHTLLALAYYNKLQWPMTKPLSKAQKEAGINEPLPIVSQYCNFRALVDFYNIKLYRDSNSPHKMYLTGDADILDKYFSHLDVRYYHGKYLGPYTEKSLAVKFNSMCQEHGYMNVTMAQVRQNIAIWVGDITRVIDLVKMFFDTPFNKLAPEYQENAGNEHISTPEFLFDCLDIDYLSEDRVAEEALYFKYYKSWLMGIARNIYYPNTQHMNNCVLLLCGPEQVRKTSHFKYILPKFMREDRVAFTVHGFSTEASVRDVTKLAAQNNLIVWDEIEQYLDADTESNFKKLIDNNPIKIIDKYEVIDTYIKPIAVYGGTSNQTEFKLSDNGSRRLFIIPVKWVDTDKMEKVNWWKVINDLRDEIVTAPEDQPPWLLSEPQLQLQAQLHSHVTAKSSLDLILEDMFDFDAEWPLGSRSRLPRGFNFRDQPDLRSASEISDRLRKAGVVEKFTRKHLVNVLKRMCGKWTNTIRGVKTFADTKMYVKKGEVYYGGRKKFWLPPVKHSPKKSRYFMDED